MQSKDTEGNSFVAVVVDDEVTFYTRNKKQLQRGCATTDLRRMHRTYARPRKRAHSVALSWVLWRVFSQRIEACRSKRFSGFGSVIIRSLRPV